MKIAFIHVPFYHRKFSENLKVVDEEFTLSPPIILAYVCSIAEKSGHHCLLIDAHSLKLSKDDVYQKIVKFNPDIIAFRLDTYNFQETIEWIKYFKNKTKKTIIVGGINLDIYPYETMSYNEIDFGFMGEVIESLPKFLDVFGDEEKYKEVPGLLYRKNGRIILNPKNNYLVDFDKYPFPARHQLPNNIYHSFVSQIKNFTIMLTSTGCPYRCRFCAIAALKHYRQRSVENVIREIEECYYDYGIREIDFFDATFFVNKDWSIRFCQEIIKRKLNIVWTCRSRVDIVRDDVLEIASKAGCRMIFWGIESSSQNVLDAVNKQTKKEQIEFAIKTSKKYGISNLGFIMIGNPGDSRKTIKDTLSFVKKIDLDYIQVCRAIAKPNTEYHKQLIKETNYDYWKEFVLGRIKERRIETPWVDLNHKEIEDFLRYFYYGFYLRPSYIIKRILKIKSFDEFLRYIRVGLRMIAHYFYTDVSFAKTDVINKLAHMNFNLSSRDLSSSFVIIPSYNEGENIVKLVRKIFQMYPSINVIVCDSSDDGTYEKIKDIKNSFDNLEIIYVPKKHKGNERGVAIKEGLKLAIERGAKFIIEMDGDMSHDPSFINNIIDHLEKYDVVIGSRFIDGAMDSGRNIFRKILGYFSNLYIRYMLNIYSVKDITSGYRGFTRKAIMNMDVHRINSVEGTEMIIEMLFFAINKGFSIKEIPIVYLKRGYGNSKFGIWTIIRSFKKVISLRRAI